MPNLIFTLTPDVLKVAELSFNSLIINLGRTCRMFYNPKIIPCINCVYDSINRKSSGVYLSGGPYPFPMGSQCPVCYGKGTITEDAYEDVTLLIQEDVKQFQKIGNLNFPNGSIQTKGFIADLPKIQRCDYMLKHVDLSSVLPQKYKLYGEPLCPGNIVQSKYFVCLWERIL